MIEYIVGYIGKPAMAESKILAYDGEYITFWYQRQEDNRIIKERIYVYNFFKRLIIYILDENLKLFGIMVYILKNTNFMIN